MRQSIRLGRVAGVEIGANWSVLVIIAILAWGLSGAVFPAAAPGQPRGAYLAAGVLVAVAFMACLTAHEAAHALAARYFGIRVRRITLWLLGGVSELEDEAPTPRAELVVAGAGPLTSVLLGTVGTLAAGWARLVGMPELAVSALVWLGGVNLMLGVFNLLPGAPLDGGRILHAALWRMRGDRYSAQISAGRVGVGVGASLVVGGLAVVVFAGDLSGLWLTLLGWYLVSAASAESASARLRAVLTGVTVDDIMTPGPVCAYAGQSVGAFVAAVATSARHRAFPVVELDGRPVGVVDLATLARVAPAERDRCRIAAVARPLPPAAVLRPADGATAAAGVLSPATPLVVVVDGSRTVGVVTAVDVARAVELERLAPHP